MAVNIQRDTGFKSSIINKIIEMLNRATVKESEDIGVTQTSMGTTLRLKRKSTIGGASRDMPQLWEIHSIIGDNVHIGYGLYRRADLLVAWDVDPAGDPGISISADKQWVGYQFDPSNNSLTVTGPHDSLPQDHDGLVAGPLYQFSYKLDASGNPMVAPILRCASDVIVTSQFKG